MIEEIEEEPIDGTVDATDDAINDDAETASGDNPVDAVFVIGTGSKNGNEELRYALRNLDANCRFVRNVYICGECPAWADTTLVHHLKWPDRFSHAKDANIIDKLRHACETEGIAKNILFCSDDQFQTKECTWDDFSPRWLRRYSSTDGWYEGRKRVWHTRLRKTLERERIRRKDAGLSEADVFYYQPHMWMQIDRDKFIEYAKWCDYEHRDDTIIASGYFNFIDAGGDSNFDHVFISPGQSWPVAETHVAYSDASFTAAMTFLKKAHPMPCSYEISPNSVKLTPGHRPETEIIADFKSRVYSEPVWRGLKPEMNEAEEMRAKNAPGWRKVWNDIIRRWTTATEKGRLYLPVPGGKSSEAENFASLFRKLRNDDKVTAEPAKNDAEAEDGSPATRTRQTDAPTKEDEAGKPAEMKVEDPSKKKGCPKCEEKRRRLKEEARKRAAAMTAEAGRAISRAKVTVNPDDESIHEDGVVAAADPVGVDNANDMDCVDCAIEHLSVAAAYLNARLARPTPLEVELAKGEISVASQHLLAAKRSSEYNRCVEILDSADEENSLLSTQVLRKVIGQLIGG